MFNISISYMNNRIFTQTDTPAVRLLDQLLDEAKSWRASDIHIEPLEKAWRVRLRIDGQLHEIIRPAVHLREALINRIKVLAKLDISERRIPQDGRLKLIDNQGNNAEFRVNTLPTLFGEKVVLRRLDTLPAELNLLILGYSAQQAELINAALRSPTGMILVTGPTGSGKTLSLFCFLQILNTEALNICTVEDPAEIRLPGLNQVNVHEKAGLDFATTLKSFLRQDPDIIMVGEIRDFATADVALKAAQTGHRVLSTLHTNDAPSTLIRLLDIGIAPFRLAAGIRMITAQRLIRCLCESCKLPVTLSTSALHAAGYTSAKENETWQAYSASGCAACYGIGYHKRVGIHQLLPITPAIQEQIVARVSGASLTQLARAAGMPTLRQLALNKVKEGITSLEEAMMATEINEF